MTFDRSGFFVAGGSLRSDTPSYVERHADRELYDALDAGEFCYVLTSRQMGKSSLMVRTVARLREDNLRVVVLDLTALGQNLRTEQWYYGLLGRLGEQLELEAELDAFWSENERLGPCRRWMKALRDVALADGKAQRAEGKGQEASGADSLPHAPCPMPAKRLVVFIDEIDVVRSLPFSTDEFFAAIRECYNRRTDDPEFDRLTFCLLGVAAPTDLIRDTRMTPFNIGRRIELTDFTEEEAQIFAVGLEVGDMGEPGRPERVARSLLKRVLCWTGGHPYLTQRLCQAVAADPSVAGASGVDRVCESLFLAHRAQEIDDNLIFVRERLVRSESDLAAVLELYGQVMRGRRVPDEETSALAALMRLSGVVKSRDGLLRVRNRIYRRVFDKSWIVTHMPGAELRRQRSAYRRGMARTAIVGTAMLAVVGCLGLVAARNARKANAQGLLVTQERENLRRNLYAADVNLAQEALDAGNLVRARHLLAAYLPKPGSLARTPTSAGQTDLRGFEWRWLWQRCRGDDLYAFRGSPGLLWGASLSPDGKLLATAGEDAPVRVWDTASHRQVAALQGHEGLTMGAVFSPDGRTLATTGFEGTVRLWAVDTWRQLAVLAGHRGWVWPVTFTPDGNTLATGSEDHTVRLWDVRARKERAVLRAHSYWVWRVVVSPTGDLMASSSGDGTTALWRLGGPKGARLLGTFPLAGEVEGSARSLAFSPDGRFLAAGGATSARVLDVSRFGGPGSPARWSTPRAVSETRHPTPVWSVAFSPDGRRLATGSDDGLLRLWDLRTGRIEALHGHENAILSVAFSPDGSQIVTASWDGTARLWPAHLRREESPLRLTIGGREEPADCVAFSPDGRMLALDRSAPEGRLHVFDARSLRKGSAAALREVAAPRVPVGDLYSCCMFSPRGELLAVGGYSGPMRLVRTSDWRVVGHFPVADVRDIRFSPDGHLITVAEWEHGVHLWDPGEGGSLPRHLGTLAGTRGQSVCTAFSPDGAVLATGGVAEWLRLWDVANRREIGRLGGVRVRVHAMAFSPDGKTLAAGLMEHGIELWDLPSRKRSAVLQGHAAEAASVAWLPDGNTLASGSYDGTVRLWNVATGREVARLEPAGNPSAIVQIAVSPDGTAIAAVGDRGAPVVWYAPPLSEIDHRAMLGGRNSD
jgi:WD40 repeat protein